MPFNFQDIFKSGFLEEVNAVPPADMALALGLAFAVGLFIFYIYKRCYAGVLYSASFGVTLIALTMITSLLILAVTSNVVLSLGMVGALSIVRFRAAIKEPVEIVFLFWSLAVGIVIGAGMIPLAIIGSVLIGLILLLFANRKIHSNTYILVLTLADETDESGAIGVLRQSAAHFVVKSKTVSAAGIELTAELRTRDASTAFVNQIQSLSGVESATLVSYNGEYLS